MSEENYLNEEEITSSSENERGFEELRQEIKERINIAKKRLEVLHIFMREILEVSVDNLYNNINTALDKEDKHFSPELLESITNAIRETEEVILRFEKAEQELEKTSESFRDLDEELRVVYNKLKQNK